MLEISYGGTCSDDDQLKGFGLPSPPVLWGPVQEANFSDASVDYAGNPHTSGVPMTTREIADWSKVVAECMARTLKDTTADD